MCVCVKERERERERARERERESCMSRSVRDARNAETLFFEAAGHEPDISTIALHEPDIP